MLSLEMPTVALHNGKQLLLTLKAADIACLITGGKVAIPVADGHNVIIIRDNQTHSGRLSDPPFIDILEDLDKVVFMRDPYDHGTVQKKEDQEALREFAKQHQADGP